MNQDSSRLYTFFSKFESLRWTLALKAVVTGAAAGLLAVVYRLATEYGAEKAAMLYMWMKVHPVWIIVWGIAAVATGLFIAWLIKLEPMASGGGVPQVEGIVLYGLKMRWYTVIAIRYIAGILGSLFGLSFGPEGPSIQLGAAINQGLSKKFARTKLEENYLVTSGAAAGLTAAFSAPLTGVIFALEEIHRSFSPLILLSATTASLTADFISKYFFGLKPILYSKALPQLPLHLYVWLIPLALFAGLAGVATNKGMLFTQTLFNKLPAKYRVIVTLLIALPCGLFLPQVLGGGRDLVNIFSENYALYMLFLIFIVKLVFSCTSIGSGTPGGIFMPIIAISALSGSVFAALAVHLGLPSQYAAIMVICAMAGGLSACVKAPITSIVLIVEITSSFIHILPVALCSFVALFLSDIFRTAPIYEAFLHRYIHKNGYADDDDEDQKRGEVTEFPVEYGSDVQGKHIREIIWPKGALVVGLRRGNEELVPRGDTKILTGDYMLVLVPRGRSNEIKHKLRRLCRTRV